MKLKVLINLQAKNSQLNDNPLGMGYRERVDFGEFIGYFISDKNPQLKLQQLKG